MQLGELAIAKHRISAIIDSAIASVRIITIAVQDGMQMQSGWYAIAGAGKLQIYAAAPIAKRKE